jgi:glycosyltransferase involved in cell wall biosynthesis
MSVDLSVIVPTFRRPAALLEAVRSALSQEQVQVEVLVLDDSPEGSAQAAVERIGDPRVSYRRMEQPSGGKPALVRNIGWQQARGRFVHFLDDDDRVAEGAYAALVAALDARPQVGVAFGRVEPFGDHREVLLQQQAYFQNAARRARISQRLGSRHLMVTNMLFKPTVLVNSACIIRRDCIAPLGGYDPELQVVEDVDFYLRAIRKFGCIFIDEVVLHYRTGAPSLMHNLQDNDPVVASYRQMFAKYRAEQGTRELLALKLLARTALRWL